MVKRKKKGERYIDRWRREHPEIRLYLSRSEYDELKQIADGMGLSVKELVIQDIKNVLKKHKEAKAGGDELSKAIREWLERISKGF
jgi:Mn-dependent DtxR family transcriptional regulator